MRGDIITDNPATPSRIRVDLGASAARCVYHHRSSFAHPGFEPLPTPQEKNRRNPCSVSTSHLIIEHRLVGHIERPQQNVASGVSPPSALSSAYVRALRVESGAAASQPLLRTARRRWRRSTTRWWRHIRCGRASSSPIVRLVIGACSRKASLAHRTARTRSALLC